MRKRHLLFLLVPVFITMIFILSGCELVSLVKTVELKDDVVYETTVGQFDYSAVTVVVGYSDGTSEELPLTADMIPSNEILKLYKPGEQSIKIVYGTASCELKVNVKRNEFGDGIALECGTFEYDGNKHSVSVKGKLPEGATVKYPDGNSFINAGEYPVSAVLVCDGYETKVLKGKLVINKAVIDVSGIKFDDVGFVYDGSDRNPEAENIPDGVTVVYEMYASDGKTKTESAKEVGTYIQKLRMISNSGNYTLSENEKTRTITVTQASYETDEIVFSNKTVTYDGYAHKIEIADPSKLPEGVKYRYVLYEASGINDEDLYEADLSELAETENAIDAGKYIATAVFEGDSKNYEEIPEMRAWLTIEKKIIDVSQVTLGSAFCDYEYGKLNSLTVTGNLPEGITVKYCYNGEEAEGVTRSGRYDVKAVFVCGDEKNCVAVPEYAEATLIVNSVTEDSGFTADNILYDPDAKEGMPQYKIEGLKEGVNVNIVFKKGDATVEPEDLKRGESYSFVATFGFDDEDKNASCDIPEVSGDIRLRQKVEIQSVTLNDLTVTYDKTSHSIVPEEELPEDLLVYENNGQTDAGVYEVTATFNEDEYIVIYQGEEIFSATLTIEKKFLDLSGITFEDEELTYDKNSHSLTVSGELPDDVTVEYTGNTATNAGVYPAKAEFKTPDDINYEINVTELNATLTINKVVFDTASFVFDDLTETYNGEEHEIELIGEIPEDLTVTYTDTVKTEPGTYEAKVTFEAPDDINYELTANELTATLVINKIMVTVPEFQFKGVTATYDENPHSLTAITGLPDYITITYSDELTKTDAGNYYITASLAHTDSDHYELSVTEKSALLKINKKQIDLIEDLGMENAYQTPYDGTKKYYPIDMLSEFENVSMFGDGQSEVGRYKLTLNLSDKNYAFIKYGEEATTFTFYLYVTFSADNLCCLSSYWQVTGISYNVYSYEISITFEVGVPGKITDYDSMWYNPWSDWETISGYVEYASYEKIYFNFTNYS